VEVVPLEQAIVRYRAAVDMKDELDPEFVIMAQCYARDAANGGLEDCLQRLRAYEEVAGVDWVQFESPHSVEEIRQARASVSGPLSFMRGKLPRYLSLEEHQALGVFIAWYPAFTHEVMYAALWDFMQDFQARGLAAWEAFQASRQGRPYPHPLRLDAGETVAKQRELEERYYTATRLEKYQRSPGGRRASS
jgi:2-methylisocitrate lyase-like PEP mutase family enzyme